MIVLKLTKGPIWSNKSAILFISTSYCWPAMTADLLCLSDGRGGGGGGVGAGSFVPVALRFCFLKTLYYFCHFIPRFKGQYYLIFAFALLFIYFVVYLFCWSFVFVLFCSWFYCLIILVTQLLFYLLETNELRTGSLACRSSCFCFFHFFFSPWSKKILEETRLYRTSSSTSASSYAVSNFAFFSWKAKEYRDE